MVIHKRTQIRKGNRVVMAQGAAAALAFTLMLGVAARGVQSQPDVQAQQSSFQVTDQVSDLAQNNAAGQIDGDTEKSVVLIGTVVKDGDVPVFREQTGKVYHMKEPSKAKSFENKPVKITGKVDEATGLLVVEKIETAHA